MKQKSCADLKIAARQFEEKRRQRVERGTYFGRRGKANETIACLEEAQVYAYLRTAAVRAALREYRREQGK